MSSGAHEEYLDVDSATDEGFIYYLTERAWDLEAMIEDYIIKYNLNHLEVYDDLSVYVNVFREVYRAMIFEESGTRLTDDQAKDIYNYVKYQKSANYAALTNFDIDICRDEVTNESSFMTKLPCYGNNIERNAAIHWRCYLADSSDCDFQYLTNGATAENLLTLENFPCQYENESPGFIITASTTAFNTYLNGFVLEGDKKKKERVSFKLFLKNYIPVTASTNKNTLQNDFYTDLISDTIHSHNKNNVVSRLATTKRWKRRVLAKLPPFA